MEDDNSKSKNENGKQPSIDPGLLNILKNSAASSLKYQQEKAGTEAKKCTACGAARPVDSDLKICDFCGNPF